ncbi:uncharacterized protein LOC115886832 [Sitophilus oryzae]|uniref:Uncharacterized protein LOC115886832 n=1 Tax=Sitophilus oryzae TaxID=7048 RepID=A0A6J2YEZ8_SITOR|nr:uncharacterized protein LOC115886832 [Sitophilus oryzae]
MVHHWILISAIYTSLLIVEGIAEEKSEVKHRSKRYLLFPYQGTFKTVYSFAIPWKLGPKQEMGVGWNFQFQYPLPYNTTSISNFPEISRKTRNIANYNIQDTNDRALLYQGIEKLLDSNGFNGKECVLQTICEYAGGTMPNGENGLLDQVLYLLLTPNYNDGPDPTLDPIYSDAQKAGEFGVDCKSSFYDCKLETDIYELFAGLQSKIMY